MRFLSYRQREKGPSLDAVLSLAGLLILPAPRNCLGGARHCCDLGFGSGIAQGYAALGQIGSPIYGWFTEGFDTPDLKEAKALLDELDGP